jgi:hypothetical protein
MNQAPTARNAGTRSLLWLLLVTVALMGLSVTRQQALGSLHLHADASVRDTTTLGEEFSRIGAHWRARWQMQQVFGHGQMAWGVLAQEFPLWPTNDSRSVPAHDHAHGAAERHHHGVGDDSVLALDGAAEAASAAEGSTASAVSWFSAVGTPSVWPLLLALNTGKTHWPVYNAMAFSSRTIAPPLRPPAP